MGNFEGLRISNSTENIFQNNNLESNVHNLAGETTSIDINPSNTVNGNPIYIWYDQHDKTVPTDAGYVALVNCSGIIVEGLKISNNEVGILLQNTNNCTISTNTIASATFGIQLRASSGVAVANNNITACQDGIIIGERLNKQQCLWQRY